MCILFKALVMDVEIPFHCLHCACAVDWVSEWVWWRMSVCPCVCVGWNRELVTTPTSSSESKGKGSSSTPLQVQDDISDFLDLLDSPLYVLGSMKSSSGVAWAGSGAGSTSISMLPAKSIMHHYTQCSQSRSVMYVYVLICLYMFAFIGPKHEKKT